MIKLTRLGGEAFVLNAELIRYIENRPDTFVTLISGERLVVLESMDEVVRRAIDYQRSKHLFPPLCDSESSRTLTARQSASSTHGATAPEATAARN